MSTEANSPDLFNVTSSPESAVGAMRSNSLAGQQAAKSGQEAAHASRSAAQEKLMDFATSGTYGPLFIGSSPSAVLQQSLENKLQARMGVYGSPEYELTWKSWDMLSGPPICALRASPRLIFDKDCIGWQTPTKQDAHGRNRHNQKNGTVILSLLGQAQLCGHPTPFAASDGGSHGKEKLNQILGWSTPTRQDGKNNAAPSQHRRHHAQGSVMAAVLGWSTPTAITDTGGAALCKWGGTASRAKLKEAVGNTVLNGALNPAFPCWLMGFPDGWLKSAALAMPSCRKSRRNS